CPGYRPGRHDAPGRLPRPTGGGMATPVLEHPAPATDRPAPPQRRPPTRHDRPGPRPGTTRRPDRTAARPRRGTDRVSRPAARLARPRPGGAATAATPARSLAAARAAGPGRGRHRGCHGLLGRLGEDPSVAGDGCPAIAPGGLAMNRRDPESKTAPALPARELFEQARSEERRVGKEWRSGGSL